MTNDTISRQAAISAICNACGKIDCDKMDKCEKLQLPPFNNSEIPNSSDTISRQAAIDEIEGVDWYHQNKNGEMVHGANSKEHQPWYKSQDIYKALKAVPAVDTVPRWIPCSERLPDYDVEVLATTEWGGITIAERNEPRTGEKDYWWFLAEGNINGDKGDIIAWMNLPEPYKEKKDE